MVVSSSWFLLWLANSVLSEKRPVSWCCIRHGPTMCDINKCSPEFRNNGSYRDFVSAYLEDVWLFTNSWGHLMLNAPRCWSTYLVLSFIYMGLKCNLYFSLRLPGATRNRYPKSGTVIVMVLNEVEKHPSKKLSNSSITAAHFTAIRVQSPPDDSAIYWQTKIGADLVCSKNWELCYRILRQAPSFLATIQQLSTSTI